MVHVSNREGEGARLLEITTEMQLDFLRLKMLDFEVHQVMAMVILLVMLDLVLLLNKVMFFVIVSNSG